MFNTLSHQLKSSSFCLLRSFSRAMSSTPTPLLLSPAQLKKLRVSNDPVSVIDASWHMPNSPRQGRNEFMMKRIPGAQYLDLDEVASSHELGLKHMMPEPRVFADACENLGIGPSSHVVLYDAHGVFSSPRALFMFRSFGHEKSSILDGGLPLWEAEGNPIETESPAEVEKAVYPTPKLDTGVIKSYEQMVSNSKLDPSEDSIADLVLDARSRARYLGTAAEPRPGLSSGHIPNSFSLAFDTFLQTHTVPDSSAKYTTFLPTDRLREALVEAVGREQAEHIIKGERPVTTSCGSGMTAGVLWLGLRLLGVSKIGFYDESWTGYAMRPSSKIEKSK